MVVITGMKRAISLLTNVENVRVWMPMDKGLPEPPPVLLEVCFGFSGASRTMGWFYSYFQPQRVHLLRARGLEGCVPGPILLPGEAGLGAGAWGPPQGQPPSSALAQSLWLIVTHQLTQSQERPSSAFLFQVSLQVTAWSQHPSCHTPRLPRHTAPALQALKVVSLLSAAPPRLQVRGRRLGRKLLPSFALQARVLNSGTRSSGGIYPRAWCPHGPRAFHTGP